MKRILFRALRKLGLLQRITVYPRIRLQGSSFKLPIINGIGLTNYLNLGEPWMQHLLKSLVDDSKTFLDVGVNLSQTLLKVKAVSPSAHYIGFEPNPLCVYYTNEVIKANAFSNTQIFPVGISERSEVLQLNLYSEAEHDSSASIIKEFRDVSKVRKTLNVPVFNPAELTLNNSKPIGIIKIDVEGAELEVLRGLKGSILTDRPFVLIEILPAYSTDNPERIKRQDEIKRLMDDCEYTVFRVHKDKKHYQEISKIEAFEIHADLNLCEYIFCPNERVDDMKSRLAN